MNSPGTSPGRKGGILVGGKPTTGAMELMLTGGLVVGSIFAMDAERPLAPATYAVPEGAIVIADPSVRLENSSFETSGLNSLMNPRLIPPAWNGFSKGKSG